MQLPQTRSSRALWRVLVLGILFSVLPLSAATTLLARPLWLRAPAASQKAQTTETWMGLYMGSRKVGYAHLQTLPATYQGKPALRSISKSVTKLTVLGSAVEQEESQETLSDLRYQPLEQTFNIKSNGSAIQLTATYDYAAHKVTCRLNTGGAQTTKTLTIPKDAVLAGDTNFLTAGQPLSVGQKLSFYFLNPLNVELEEAKVEVAGRETLKDAVSGKMAPTFVIKAHLSLGDMTSWETEDGDTLKNEMSLAGITLTMLKEPQAVALNPEAQPLPAPGASNSGGTAYTPPADFAVATAIGTDRPIQDARNVRALTVTIAGVPEKRFVLSDDRQRAEILPVANALAGYTVRYDIRATPFEAANAARLPITDPALKPYLWKAAYLDTSDVNIRSTAARLRGKEKNLYRIAVRIRDWVHKNMRPDASIGVPRSASDIFLRRRGVCRDYATFYTALARAAGVPTRLCGGIVYAEDKFFYHAWAESYVGQWVAFDPTLPAPSGAEPFVDATHIKFTQGDPMGMFRVVGIVGKLHITVQDFAL
ncbi:MAG TPA: transglutaminase-like domain-containing protein [Chthonomonadaceae bacterium]|nr:transglutaminase-like domain-containing protein [Chthonomonadaceae bacterium]